VASKCSQKCMFHIPRRCYEEGSGTWVRHNIGLHPSTLGTTYFTTTSTPPFVLVFALLRLLCYVSDVCFTLRRCNGTNTPLSMCLILIMGRYGMLKCDKWLHLRCLSDQPSSWITSADSIPINDIAQIISNVDNSRSNSQSVAFSRKAWLGAPNSPGLCQTRPTHQLIACQQSSMSSSVIIEWVPAAGRPESEAT